MSKKRGLSAEEKRDRLLEVFHETADVFVLKDVEKAGVKKGLNGMMVKEILQSLVDDDLVRQEKIGISNYFWSFPSEASVKVNADLSRLEGELAAVRKRKADLQALIVQERKGKEDTAARAQAMAALTKLRQQVAEATAEIEKYKDNDPAAVQAMRQGADVAKDAANRWLDNLTCLESWCKKRFEGHHESIKALFEENGYKDTMDYVS